MNIRVIHRLFVFRADPAPTFTSSFACFRAGKARTYIYIIVYSLFSSENKTECLFDLGHREHFYNKARHIETLGVALGNDDALET